LAPPLLSRFESALKRDSRGGRQVHGAGAIGLFERLRSAYNKVAPAATTRRDTIRFDSIRREGGNVVEAGQPAPDFTLSDQHGQPVTLAQFRGTPVVLYFYPKDDTPGCTKQACAFRDARADYEKAGAKVIGVSPDSPASHEKFAEKYQLAFTLVADPEKRACEAYGVWKEKNMYGKKSMGVERTTVLIDANGVVRRIFPKVKVAGHVTKVMEALGSL
jgi:peroxiredoxin Q/BCP